MITFIPALTKTDHTTASVADVVEHIKYVAERIGYDHIGVGTDFDGMERSVSGLEDASHFPRLLAAMLANEIPRADVEKVIGLNLIRVLRSVEKVAEETFDTAPVLEDKVKQLWNEDIRSYVRQVYPNVQ